jgi:hypothetical protein
MWTTILSKLSSLFSDDIKIILFANWIAPLQNQHLPLHIPSRQTKAA